MAMVHGKDSYFSIDSVNITTFLDSASMSATKDMAESSTMGNDAKTFVAGMTGHTVSLSGRYDSTASTGPDDTMYALVGDDTATTFEFGPEGGGDGKIKYSGSAFVTAYNVSAPIGDVVAWTGELQITGDVTRGTFSS